MVNGWSEEIISKVAPLQRGFDLPTTKVVEGKYPVVYSNGIGRKHAEFMVKGPGVVTGRSGTIGKVHYIDESYWPHNTSLWVTNFFGNCPKYIYYLYLSLNFEKFSTGSGVPTLNRNDLHSNVVLLPPLAEQEAIAWALSDVDALIESLEKLITKKRAIKTATMQELLTGKTRLPGFSNSGEMQSTELGKIPKDWRVATVGSALKIRHGKSQNEVLDANGKYPIYGTGGEMGRANQPLYSKPSVLIGRKGTIDKPRYVDKPFWTVDTLFYSEISNNADAKFLYYKFCFIDWYSHNEASGVPSLNAATIEKIQLAIPTTKKEQSAIAAVISDADDDIDNAIFELKKVKNLKQGMMQELLTGRTRLV